MKLTIKIEYLDSKILCPASRKEVYCRFIPTELYNYYYNNGYECIFETKDYTTYNKELK